MQERKIHLAHQAMMLEDTHHLLAINRQQIKAHGRVMAELPQLSEEPMGIHIGDVHVAPQTATKVSSLGKLLAMAALGAGLMATGGAGALGLSALLKPASAIAAPPVPLDVEIPWQWQDGKMQFGKPRPVT